VLLSIIYPDFEHPVLLEYVIEVLYGAFTDDFQRTLFFGRKEDNFFDGSSEV
jgi:hypothetical protein